jgi:hypothetical protein
VSCHTGVVLICSLARSLADPPTLSSLVLVTRSLSLIHSPIHPSFLRIVYSVFALCEWFTVCSNIAFHYAQGWDTAGCVLYIGPDPTLHKQQ